MTQPQTMEFKTELEQLLDIIVHSLYSEREIFLRELISNASDAIDKLRFAAIAEPALAGEDTEWKIELRVDKDARTLSIIDNGIGMSPSTIVEHLGTIARSGTKEFVQALRESDASQRPELVRQFAVGFYTVVGGAFRFQFRPPDQYPGCQSGPTPGGYAVYCFQR